MDKKALRKEMLDKRNNIAAAKRQEKSGLIKERLEKLQIYHEAYTVMFYVSFGSEVETRQLIKDALKAEKRVAVPLVNKKELLIKQITDFKQLSPGTWGIFEPDHKLPDINPKDINVVIVPGIAFTIDHNRLGYGGGYYDKLLSKEGEANFTSIALAFEEQVVEKLPVAEHDQKVDFIVTDKRFI